MKNWMFTLVLFSLSVGFMVGCGSDKDNKGQNYDQYGYYDPYTNRYYDGYSNYGSPVNPNEVILQGPITITDADAYRNYLVGAGVCMHQEIRWSPDIKTCGPYVGSAPGLVIRVSDYQFRNGNTSSGSSTLYVQQFPVMQNVTWRMYNGGTGFNSQQLGNMYTSGYNRTVGVNVVGKSTDAIVVVELVYNGRPFGQGQLSRVNL